MSTRRFEKISVGEFSCGIDVDGGVECWGDELFPIPSLEGPYVDISTGFCQACGLDAEGRMDCWGCPKDEAGADPLAGEYLGVSVGLGYVCGIRADDRVLECGGSIGGLPRGIELLVLVSGAEVSCGISEWPEISPWGGNIFCWGKSDAVFNAPSFKATSLGAGKHHFCAIDRGGRLYCWGMGAGGGELSPPSGEFVSVDGSCALKADGRPHCWGGANYPKILEVPEGCFTQISSLERHACGLRGDGYVVCWGDDEMGQASPP